MTHQDLKTIDGFLDKQFYISVAAGMNQRYHLSKASWYGWADRAIRIVVGILAVAGAIFSLSYGNDVAWYVAAVLSFISAVAAVALNVAPFASREDHHRSLYIRWCDLREEADSLTYNVKERPADHLIERLHQLERRITQLTAHEIDKDDSLLHRSYKEEVASRRSGQSGFDEAANAPVVASAT